MDRALLKTMIILACAVALMAMTAACSKPKPVVAPDVGRAPQPAATPAVPMGAERPADVSAEPDLTAAPLPSGGVATGELPQDLAELNRAGYLRDVFFDTDKSDLTPETRDLLAANAEWLRQHPTVRILVEGHCDERNTAEYNLALGWRRANAVKSYLVSLGVAGTRIDTISYGEERPFALGHDESAWRLNRRAHFVIIAR